jgi:hypothetical protein
MTDSIENAMLRAQIQGMESLMHNVKSQVLNIIAEICDHAENQDYDAIVELCKGFTND